MCVAGPGVKSAERTHIDDAAVRRTEMRQGFARDQEGAASVGFEDGVPLSEGQALEGGEAKTAALLTRMSRRPKAAVTWATAARTDCSERTSQGTERERWPRAVIAAAVAAASDSEER